MTRDGNSKGLRTGGGFVQPISRLQRFNTIAKEGEILGNGGQGVIGRVIPERM